MCYIWWYLETKQKKLAKDGDLIKKPMTPRSHPSLSPQDRYLCYFSIIYIIFYFLLIQINILLNVVTCFFILFLFTFYFN